MRRISVQAGAAVAFGALCLGLNAFGPPAQAAHGSARFAPHRRQTPPDSYLQYKVYSVEQLIQQVSQNPQVRQRFARHFQIPESRVVSYMRANLVESYIPKTGRYTVYCVHRSGTFYPVKQTFRRGTKVFALRNGEPVMKWVCGNPLSHFLPSVQVKLTSVPPPVTKVSPYRDTLPADTADVLVPAEVTAPVYQPLVPIPASVVSSAAGSGGAGRALFLLPALGLIGLHGGHSHTNVILPAVPEIGSALYLAVGLPVVLTVVRRRRLAAKARA